MMISRELTNDNGKRHWNYKFESPSGHLAESGIMNSGKIDEDSTCVDDFTVPIKDCSFP